VDVRGVWLALDLGQTTTPGGLLDQREGAMSNQPFANAMFADLGDWCPACGEHRTEPYVMQCPVCADESARRFKAWMIEHHYPNASTFVARVEFNQQSDCRGQE
jgi:predicted amidophosphoribosyltransferase